MRFGFMNAWLVGFGAMVADGVFMMLIYFGLAQVIDTPFMKTFLWLFGFFVLTYTGIENIAKANSIGSKETSNRNGSNRKSFQTGFFIAISNPLNILFCLGIY
ncbi:LysE family transporter, partial [Micrococcus sp. SIMBA_131]